MAFSGSSVLLPCLLLLVIFAHPSHAFGAGNIGSTSKIEGQNWRHGDIEDTLLTLLISRAAGGKKFSKLDVKRVYFGNWLRDYSQAVDVGTVKYVSAEAIRILLWVLGFMSFGYGSHEFEVTTERLGCYRPEEHIDNPKDYADNEDARQYDRRLRGPVDERRELSIDPENGLKNYIASERAGITTSAGLVRNLFGRSIQLGRQFARSRNNADLYEALRLLGTGCHCLEDFSAHSNYTELALIELGERDVFPHVGRRTQMQARGARHEIYPCVTGTFGGVDFLHSVMGEFDDKATQSEIQELEGTLQNSQNQGDTSVLQDLLNKVPDGIFGGKDQAGKANELQSNAQAHQMQNARISPRQPEEWTRYLMDVQQQIQPIIEWHDEIMKSITETIEKIPILPDLIEQLQEQVNVFVFSLLAPFVVPIINQVKAELNTGSSEIIQSSVEKQHIVFRDDRSTDPTHSMLSKDHFSNVLNEPAGKVASQVLKWVVPQVISAWDDERVDVDRTLTRIVTGVLHHPALRDHGDDGASDGRRLMFGVVEQWWREMSEREKDGLRGQLSREGVESGRNHKPGVHDKGHGCGKPLGMPNLGTAQSSGAMGGLAGAAALGGLSEALGGGGGSSGYGKHGSGGDSAGIGKMASEAVGGGALGGVVGGLVGGLGGDLLGGAFGEKEKKSSKRESYGKGGEHNTSYSEVGQSGGRYGQAEYRTQDTGYGHKESYQRFDRDESGGYGGSYESRETKRTSGGYQQTYQQSYETSSGGYQSRKEETSYGGGYGGGGGYGAETYSSSQHRQKKNSDSDNDSDSSKKKKKQHKKEKKYGRKDSDNDSDSDDNKRKSHSRQQEYGSGGGGGYGRQEEYGSGGYEGGGARQTESSYGSAGYGGSTGTGRQQESYGSSGGYGRSEEYGSSGGYSGRQEESGYGASGGYGGGGAGGGVGSGGGYGRSEYSSGGNEGYGRSAGYGGSSGSGGGGYGSGGYREERREGYGSGGDRGGGGGYGGGDEYGERSGGGYGESQEGYGGSSGGYGESGGYGGSSGYGERREYGDDY